VTEQTLHQQLKQVYSGDGGLVEAQVSGYRVDVLKDGVMVEVQTQGFYSLRRKIRELASIGRLRLVYPVARRKWIVKLSKEHQLLSRRRSPKRGRVEDVFNQLVYVPNLLVSPGFEVEVALVDLEEVRVERGRRRRRRRWSVYDRRMLEFVDSRLFSSPEELGALLPESLPQAFTSRELSRELGITVGLARRMLYTLYHMGQVERCGKVGRSYLYRNPQG